MIKLIASDLDGTLLQNGAQELNPEIYDLILALKERGIHFAAAAEDSMPVNVIFSNRLQMRFPISPKMALSVFTTIRLSQ